MAFEQIKMSKHDGKLLLCTRWDLLLQCLSIRPPFDRALLSGYDLLSVNHLVLGGHLLYPLVQNKYLKAAVNTLSV